MLLVVEISHMRGGGSKAEGWVGSVSNGKDFAFILYKISAFAIVASFYITEQRSVPPYFTSS